MSIMSFSLSLTVWSIKMLLRSASHCHCIHLCHAPIDRASSCFPAHTTIKGASCPGKSRKWAPQACSHFLVQPSSRDHGPACRRQICYFVSGFWALAGQTQRSCPLRHLNRLRLLSSSWCIKTSHSWGHTQFLNPKLFPFLHSKVFNVSFSGPGLATYKDILGR